MSWQTWYDNLLPEDFYPRGVKYDCDGNPIDIEDEEDLDLDDDYDYFDVNEEPDCSQTPPKK